MKMQLTKGPTITPQMFPLQTVAGAEPTMVGFSGMTELDYVSTHLCAALIQKYDPEKTDVVSLAVDAAERLIKKSENVRMMRAAQEMAKREPEHSEPEQKAAILPEDTE